MGATPEAKTGALNDSAFNKWRCIIAIAHADTEVKDSELEYITRAFAGLPLSAEQTAALGEDLLPPGPDIAAVLPKVTDTEHRKELLFFGGLMAQADGDIDPREEAILRKIGAGHLTQKQVSAYLDEAKQALENARFRAALKESEVAKGSGFRAIVDAFIKKIALLPP